MAIRFFPVNFDCLVLGDPKPNLQWLKDGIVIKNSTKFNILKNGTLQILAPQRSDEGSYTCIGRNHFGSIQSVPAKLFIACMSLPRNYLFVFVIICLFNY